ncbi:uncharacterized protein TNCV_1525871 [Trichonephila clavipes]|nr:uncharacterized protein TNCV_1525871 [Trichonephila clavipes]
MKTRLRTLSTDLSSRRPLLRKKCTRTANCFIGRHPGTGSTFSRCPCVFSKHTKGLAEGYFGQRRPLCVLPLTPTHRRLRLEWCRARGNWSAAEWNQVVISDESDSISAVMKIVYTQFKKHRFEKIAFLM